MSEVRIYAIGGQDEAGRNMYCVETEDGIIAIEAGLKYPDANQLGIEVIIPDFSYLEKNADRFRGVIITHAHDDVAAALPYLLRQVNVPIYTTQLTAEIITKMLKKAGIAKAKIHRIERSGEFTIGKTKVRSFGTTHSIADSFGVAIQTDQGAVVFTSEFILDNDMKDPHYSMDIAELADIGKKGVLALMTESLQADHAGYTAPNHRVTGKIEPAMAEAPGRIIITAYSQNFLRIREILAIAERLNKRVFLYSEELKDLIRTNEKLGYYSMPAGISIPRDSFTNDMDNVVVLITGSGHRVFRIMNRIAMQEDSLIELRPDDTVIIASPRVAGTEVEAGIMENELYREDVNIISLDSKEVLSMHASSEDLKTMIFLMKPAYYLPVEGEYRALMNNASVGMEMGISPANIRILDNGQAARFSGGELKSTNMEITLDEILIDGDENLDVTGFVLKDRESLSTDGVIVVGIVCDHKTKKIIGGPDVQSRGVFYLKDADYIVKNIAKIITDVIEKSVAAGTYENAKARAEARERIQKYVLKETGKRPMILPAILEINVGQEEASQG